MGNRAKSLFYSGLFNKFHHRQNLIAFFLSNFGFKSQSGTQNLKTMSLKGTFHTNSGSEWENENFVKRISS
jgi:hypothetical protein